MKKYIYPACFYPEEGGQYSVIFPDFGGATYGNNLEDAMNMASDYLGGIIVTMQDDNEPLPEPSKITEIKADEYPNGCLCLIGVESESYRTKSKKAVKKTLTIPQWLNVLAENNNINFSKVLQEALKQKLQL